MPVDLSYPTKNLRFSGEGMVSDIQIDFSRRVTRNRQRIPCGIVLGPFSQTNVKLLLFD